MRHLGPEAEGVCRLSWIGGCYVGGYCGHFAYLRSFHILEGSLHNYYILEGI